MISSAVWMMNGKDQLGRILHWFRQETMTGEERDRGGRDVGDIYE